MARPTTAHPNSAGAKARPSPPEAASKDYQLGELHLDIDNPRFGGVQSKRLNERQLVNVIADEHDLSDVLSSISANGYFHSEPLIGVQNKRRGVGITIVEGNRRLAACLILAADERASDQAERRSDYLPSKFTASDTLPVSVYDWNNEIHRRQLLSYLGIRHIVGPLQWDSYAKAAWVASALDEKFLTLDEIMRMVGDKNRTMPRLLDGYYFVNQIEREKAYDPQASTRRGRGSKPEYPFSWVYNALDYDNIRSFVGLGARPKVFEADPVQKNKLEDAGELMRWMFGDTKFNRLPVISDSREIQDLARAVSQSASLRELRRGERLAVALESARPKRERARENLEDVADLAEDTFGLLLGISPQDASELLPSANRLFQAAREVRNRIQKVQDGEEGTSTENRT